MFSHFYQNIEWQIWKVKWLWTTKAKRSNYTYQKWVITMKSFFSVLWVSERLRLCLRNWCRTGPVVTFTQHTSVSLNLFLVSLSSSQAGLCVDGDSGERSVRPEEWLALGLSLNQWFLGLGLHGTFVFLSDLLQQEHISISPLSVFTCAQRWFTQDLLYGLQICLLSLK